ncbi:uncharacterized protein EDB91DRAFT_1239349 [Suillus paluster]|uniref:uncharacterized protein n=1 Tax=Suillus paluster TaxID=48578 RepID=UPI001B872686|nr:uncharacterized protein EDB91DRAFT_1239349 [Suillus paluster]KAG1728629.1 hypothetical protein EDB91DRAFT_1239349 [Suillus paluster]
MAARLPQQVARLILFSGPNCSLCDVAKLELAKVRQSYQFDLEIVNIQDKGQEKWKKKYVYWIPALHLDGKEIAKGRWDATGSSGGSCLESSPCGSDVTPNFYIDTSGSVLFQELSPQWYLYDRHVPTILGETPGPSPKLLDARFCFNCDRFHVVEAWKQQRLEWLEFFQPGKVWLYGMSQWGYPIGWMSDEDPRDSVRQRILGDFLTADADDSFLIISDEKDREVLDLNLAMSFYPKPDGAEKPVTDDSSPANSDLEPLSSTPRRWAIYPTTYFSSHHLTVYNGTAFMPLTVATSRPGSTFTAERRALWEQIISGTLYCEYAGSSLEIAWSIFFAAIARREPTYHPPTHHHHPPPPLHCHLLRLPFLPPPPPPTRPQYLALSTFAEADASNSSDMDMDLSDDE